MGQVLKRDAIEDLLASRQICELDLHGKIALSQGRWTNNAAGVAK
jgi:hypothetical protein